MFGLDLQMGRELDASLLFVPAAGTAVRFLKGGFSASLAQTPFFHNLPGWKCTSACQEWVLMARDEISGRQP